MKTTSTQNHSIKFLNILFLTCGMGLIATGCATQKSVAAKPLGTTVDLHKYNRASVAPFTAAATDRRAEAAGERLAADVAQRLRLDFPGLFEQVQLAAPVGQPDEVVVTGNLTQYKPGNRFGRAMLIGVTPAKLKGELVLKDGSTGKQIMSAPFDKLWAWGGILGASKGIEEMEAETTASIAATIAEGKGWKAPEKGSK